MSARSRSIISRAKRPGIAATKGDPDHLKWLFELDNYARAFLAETGPSPQSEAIAARLDEPKFGYLGAGDRSLLQDAIFFQCDSSTRLFHRRSTSLPCIIGCCRYVG